MRVKSLTLKMTWLAAVCFLGGMGLGSGLAAKAGELPSDILESLIVQDYGFEKSLLSFAEERIALFGRGAKMPDAHPITMLLGMILQPTEWQERPLFKVNHPDLIAVFGKRSLISVGDFQREENMAKLRQLIKTKPSVEPAIDNLNRDIHALLDVRRDFAIIPLDSGEWQSPYEANNTTGTQQTILTTYGRLCNAFLQNDSQEFAKAARELVEGNRLAAEKAGVSFFRLRVDLLNTHIRPFRWSATFYLLATLVYVGALLIARRRLAAVGLVLLALGLLAHAAGLTFRTVLVGRAPVANMYESLVFAVGGMVLFAVLFDRIYKNPIIGLGGALLGFIFMVIAIQMPLHESRIHPLRPALQSSWLTYHVITVMLSYSAFALSFLISLTYLFKRATGGDGSGARWAQRLPSLDTLDSFNYQIVAIGFPLLTIGIFTGAVWAATAWGRPWAFDPKETWSAVTWLIYGIFLHTRLLAGWKGTRSAVLGVIGFAAVLFTYLGVNYLLPGLHSYA